MKFGEEGESSDGWMMMIMAKEGRGTRNTNHVDVKMNCCKLGRRRCWAGGGVKPHHRVPMGRLSITK